MHAPALFCAVLAGLAASSAFGIFAARRTDLQSGGSIQTELLAGLSAGVLLSVAFLHLLTDAQEMLETLTDYPAANAGALFGVVFMATAQAFMPCIHSQSVPCHSNGAPLLPQGDISPLDGAMLTRFYALEASVSLHSVLIGLGMGFARIEWRELLILGVALSVHQFFEGFAIGMVAKRSQLDRKGWLVTFWLFTLSLPLGGGTAVAAKILFSSFESSTTYSWVSGMLNAFAAGLLMQIGLEMISHELTCQSDPNVCEPKLQRIHSGQSLVDPHRLAAKVLSICAGALLFGILAIWA